MDLTKLIIRPLTRAEFEQAVDWAAAEGWNPGLHDAEVFWETDPEGFMGAVYEGELVATGSIVSYGGRYGFMGFFIVKPSLRGKGIGTRLWFHRRDLLKERLDEDAPIGMDGVFEMQDWYRRGGFQFTHRNLRMEGVGKKSEAIPPAELVELSSVPFDQVAAYDRGCFGFERDRFLRRWIEMADARALGFLSEGELRGYGMIRKCREGGKIGPLFAEEPEIAEALFGALSDFGADEALWLDIPEMNEEAVSLARRHGMTEVFGCARMFHGPIPPIPWERVFGVTSFELG